MTFYHRRSCSLDVEVSASGFTKNMEKDSELLHPAGPEGEEDDEEESHDDEETSDKEDEDQETVYLEEYKHAMLELEGLKVTDTHQVTQDRGQEKTEETVKGEQKDTQTFFDDAWRDLEEEELKEVEDECPELEDLSAANKEFKPFR